MAKTPVFILTGFLGAGKSTLLNGVLRDPAFSRTAVIINEFGEVALDHDLVRVGETQVARTTTGCMCCTKGSDVRATLHDLHVMAAHGDAAFDRVIVETTGLADPAPLINDLIAGEAPASGLRDHIVARSFELAGVVTLVDIVTGELAIENQFEATKQIAFADVLVLTKTDLAGDPATLKDIVVLKEKLRSINASARILDRASSGFDPTNLFRPRPYAPQSLGDDVTGWLALEEAVRVEPKKERTGDNDGEIVFDRHGGRIRTFALTNEVPIATDAFRKFMSVMLAAAGPRLLRVKGLVNLSEDSLRPRVVHAVQHVVYPTRILDDWPSDDRRSRLVVVTDGIDPEPVRELFEIALLNQPPLVKRLFADLSEGLHKIFRPASAPPSLRAVH